MKHCYRDILDRISWRPLWFDEHAVPRFVPFDPLYTANIYARAAVLLRIRCQSCGHVFDVCLSEDMHSGIETLEEQTKQRTLHYGDPPNIQCCPSGPTMSSEPDRVLQFWRATDNLEWERVPELEIDVFDDALDTEPEISSPPVMKFRPLHDLVVIRQDPAATMTKGGLIIPGQAQAKPTEVTVLAVGHGKVLPNGTLLKPEVKVGDRVLLGSGKFQGQEVKFHGEDAIVMHESDILAIIHS